MQLTAAQQILIAAGVEFDVGLTDAEFGIIERKFGFQFPPDLRDFLSLGLPISPRWVDWRRMDDKTLRGRLDWPVDGACFDIQNNAFWLEEWGKKPEDLQAAFEIARRAFQQAPKLIPILGHRYIPDAPNEPGNPVFSVYQTDIIYYGADLLDYLQNEFRDYFGRSEHTITGKPRQIRFWSALAG